MTKIIEICGNCETENVPGHERALQKDENVIVGICDFCERSQGANRKVFYGFIDDPTITEAGIIASFARIHWEPVSSLAGRAAD